jgi:hypothetical protein
MACSNQSSMKPIFICALALGLLLGCSKKEEPPPASPTAGDSGSSSGTAPAGQPASAPNSAPANAAVAPNPSSALSEAEAALKAKEYQRAVQAMLTIQQANLNEQQAQAARNQMTRLQNDLAAAVARGDASAKAAADLLRRSASGGR